MGNGSNIEASLAAEAINSLSEMKTAIQRELEQEAEGFVRIGYLLKRTRDKELFREDGYENLYDFARAEYGLDKSTVSRFISINGRYSMDGDSPELDKKYSGFGRSKLAEMLTLPVEFTEEMRPEVTREEIRELKREIKEEAEKELEGSSKNETEKTVGDHREIAVAPAQQNSIKTKAEDGPGESGGLLKKAILDLFKTELYKSKMEKILILARKGQPKEELEDKLEEIITKTGYAQAKARGGIHIFFKTREEGITCMKAGGAKEFYSYSDFLDTFVGVFQPGKGEKWEDIWDRKYGADLPDEKIVGKTIVEKPVVEMVAEILGPEPKDDPEGDQIPGQAYIEDYPEAVPDDIEKRIEPETIDIVHGSAAPEGVVGDIAPEPKIQQGIGQDIKTGSAAEIGVEATCLHCSRGTFKKIMSNNGQFSLTINGDVVLATFDDGTKHASGIMRFNFCPVCGKGVD